MPRWLVVAALLCACRGEHKAHKKDAGLVPASAVSAHVPKLPVSDDGAKELRMIDKRIELHGSDPRQVIPLLLDRATYRGRLADYVDAASRANDLVTAEPKAADAWKLRVRSLSAIHKFADARAALEHVKALAPAAEEWQPLETTLDEATGHLDRSGPARAAAAARYANPVSLTQWAASLALEGKLDDAVALIPKAAATLHDNSPELIAWLLFQWGRLYEQKGEMATARAFFAEAHARMPGYVEAAVHLAQTMIATGDTTGAKAVATAALVEDRHPELLGVLAQLGDDKALAEAKTAWETYVKALPEAFSDHAARFYLGPGHDPARAEDLARVNFANRDTREARALYAEAALAAKDAATACTVAEPLAATGVARAQRFVAWRAFSACGRTAEAGRLAADLGIDAH